MYLKAYVRFDLKDRPKDHLGLTMQDFNIGGKGELDFHWLLSYMIASACETATKMGLITTTGQLQADLEKMREWSKGLVVETDGEAA